MFKHGVLAFILPLMLASSGCFFEATLDAKGGGEMTIKYRLGKNVKLETFSKQFESPQVSLVSKKVDKDDWGTFRIKFDDITKLSTAKFFKSATVTRVDGADKGTKVLSAKWVNEKPTKLPENAIAYYGNEVRVAVTLPGEIIKSNAKTVTGKTATWTYAMNDFYSAPEVKLEVTYKNPPEAAAAGPSTKTAPAKKKEPPKKQPAKKETKRP